MAVVGKQGYDEIAYLFFVIHDKYFIGDIHFLSSRHEGHPKPDIKVADSYSLVDVFFFLSNL